MAAHFFQPTHLVNMAPQMAALNPWELHYFFNSHFAIPDPLSCVVAYEIAGDIPADITVDAAGNIKGHMEHFGNQPSCQANKPNLAPGFTGAHWNDNGRFGPQTYDFHFTITAHWLEKVPGPNGGFIPCVAPGSTPPYDCMIRMVKDHNIDHKIFVDKYLSKDKFGVAANPHPLQPI